MAASIGQAQLLKDSFKRHVQDESLPRIERCVELLTIEEIWERFNAETPSIGNLIIHLCGNVRQWIIATLGGELDHRDRDSEFNERGPISKDELLNRIRNTVREAVTVVQNAPPEALQQQHTVQGFQENGVDILVHVTEHFSYHTGQITLATKIKKTVDLGYYAGQDLNATGSD